MAISKEVRDAAFSALAFSAALGAAFCCRRRWHSSDRAGPRRKLSGRQQLKVALACEAPMPTSRSPRKTWLDGFSRSS